MKIHLNIEIELSPEELQAALCGRDFDEFRVKPLEKKPGIVNVMCGDEELQLNPIKVTESLYDRSQNAKRELDEPIISKELEKHVAEKIDKQFDAEPNLYLRICPICGNEFVAPYLNQKFCGKECAKKNTSNLQKSKYAKATKGNVRKRYTFKPRPEEPATLPIKSCELCGNEFIPNHEKQVCCSVSCTNRYVQLKAAKKTVLKP